ncbi:MAG: KpsF/GutQ family sugar-phosphate isomerase [Gammaproteobacteria bacterium]
MTNPEEFCRLGLAVIETEAQAVIALQKRIDQRFAAACQYLLACEGRIVVLGAGKSGHIGSKIAATLASTGSPAFFVHPSDASHGDLGMITRQDVVLAISNSGETAEIITLLPNIKRLGIPLITLTGKPHSTLAKVAAVNIDVSVAAEACPLGLAPTSSTTATLVMGDALAVALLQARGFTSDDFALAHPGGILGRRLLLQIDHLMHTDDSIPKVTEHTYVTDALLEMTRKRLGMTTVINAAGKLIGIFTDGDLRRALDRQLNLHQSKVSDVMTHNCKTLASGTLAAEALQLMQALKITSFPVVDQQNTILGIIHIHDLISAGV